MSNAVRPLHLVRASAPLWNQGPAVHFCAAARPPNTRRFSQSSPTGSSAASSLDEWTRKIRAQTAIMHDTADLNKARQLLLVLPDFPAAPSPVTSSPELVPKYTGEGVLSIECGSPMPLGSELVLFNPLLSESTLAKDGTERTFGPPGGLDQRMWASGSFNFEKGSQLKVGQDVQCQVKVESVVPKQGAKTGMMVLVTRSLVYTTSEGVAMTERRTHVYRKPRPADQRKYVPLAAGKAPKPSKVEEKHSDFGFNYYATRASLFRYSAATFNAHRIHVDPEYCRNEEGHPDCLVHGPLTATLLLHLIASAARETSGQVQRFEYRATSPLTVEQTIRLRGAWESADQKEASLWALNEVGTVCMTAKATLF